jgi:urea transport system permease protein
MANILEQIFNGASLASVLVLVALGLSFTFGQMGVINMAHGEFIMAGAYIPYVLQERTHLFTGRDGAAFLAAIPLAFLVTAAMGLVLEQALIRRMYGRALDTLLATFGVSLVLQQAAKDLFGAPNVEVLAPTWLRGHTRLFGVTMPHSRLFIMALTVAVVTAVSVFLARSAQGRRVRAVTQNRDLAAVSGLPTSRVDAATFALGSGLAGVAGAAVALIGSIGPQIGTSYVIDAFLVVIVGGLGKLRGAVIAAFVLGLLGSIAAYETSASIGKALVFAAVIVFLQFRPDGLVSFRRRGLLA